MEDPVDVVNVELTDASQLKQTVNKRLFHWWMQAGNGDVPKWCQFDILDFAPYSDHITLTERTAPQCFKFKIQGEGTLDLMGRKRLLKAELHPNHERSYERDLYAYYDLICKKGKPFVYNGSIPALDREYIQFESIDLPFKGKEGATDKVLSLVVEFNKS